MTRGIRSAWAPASLHDGAVVSFDGDTLIATGGAIVEAIENRVRDARATRPLPPTLLDGAVRLLERGEAWIAPLSFVPFAAGDRLVAGERLATRAAELARGVVSACWFAHGDPVEIDVEATGSDRPYADELARTGARSASWWDVDGTALVLVHYRDGGRTERSAVHLVPVGWVSTTRPTPRKKLPRMDLDWSWGDVVSSLPDTAIGIGLR